MKDFLLLFSYRSFLLKNRTFYFSLQRFFVLTINLQYSKVKVKHLGRLYVFRKSVAIFAIALMKECLKGLEGG